MPEINRYEPRVALTGGEDGLDHIRELVASLPSGTRVALEHAEDRGGGHPRDARRRGVLPRPRGLGPHRRPRAVTPEDVETFERCISVGGVAVFPPTRSTASRPSRTRARGWTALPAEGTPARHRPAAVMFFQLDAALAASPSSASARAPRSDSSPGALTLVLPNPARRYPLACRPAPRRLGLRVPLLEGALAPLAAVGWPVLQSSANRSGSRTRAASPTSTSAYAPASTSCSTRASCRTPSTVVDLTGYEADGTWELLREGCRASGGRAPTGLSRRNGPPFGEGVAPSRGRARPGRRMVSAANSRIRSCVSRSASSSAPTRRPLYAA